MTSLIAVISFYSFTNIAEPENLIAKILLIGKKKYVRGTVLLSNEGFNGSLSGNKENVELVVNEIIKLSNANDVNIKVNYCSAQPFQKLKVKIKKEIVSLGIDNLNVQDLKGKYIEPKDWDNFIMREDVIMIDTRNNYEIDAGTFTGSINPNTNTFREFPQWVEENKEILTNKKIAMYCTGGIRCEKSTAYLKQLGYNEVFHLKGGILQYLEDTKNQSGMWQRVCFVFDDRRAVEKDLTPAEGYWLERNL